MTTAQLLRLAELLDEFASWISEGITSFDLALVTAVREIVLAESESAGDRVAGS